MYADVSLHVILLPSTLFYVCSAVWKKDEGCNSQGEEGMNEFKIIASRVSHAVCCIKCSIREEGGIGFIYNLFLETLSTQYVVCLFGLFFFKKNVGQKHNIDLVEE